MLQPGVNPRPLWLRRILLLAGVAAALLILGLLTQARRTPPELLLGGPEHSGDAARRIAELIDGSRRRVWVAMYVIRSGGEGPSQALLDRLAAAAARGVRVQVVLDRGLKFESEEPDTKHEAPAAWLTAHGVRVVLDEMDRTTHAKLVVVDDRWVVAGSHNWTFNALSANREASLVVDDPALADQASAWLAAIPGWDPAH